MSGLIEGDYGSTDAVQLLIQGRQPRGSLDLKSEYHFFILFLSRTIYFSILLTFISLLSSNMRRVANECAWCISCTTSHPD